MWSLEEVILVGARVNRGPGGLFLPDFLPFGFHVFMEEKCFSLFVRGCSVFLGTTYYILVDGWNGSAGTVQLNWSSASAVSDWAIY